MTELDSIMTVSQSKALRRKKRYKELGLESLQLRHCFNCEHSHYLFKLIPSRSSGYIARSTDNIPFFKTRHIFFKTSFFPSTTIEWNELDNNKKLKQFQHF